MENVKNTTLSFTLPEAWQEGDFFGCASLGFAGVRGEEKKTFAHTPQGIVLSGGYQKILAEAKGLSPKAALVFFGNAGGENRFLRELYSLLRCPMVGGGAAMNGTVGGLITGGVEACVFLLTDENYKVETEYQNIHRHELGTVKVDFDEADPRTVTAIDGQEPKAWLDTQKAALGFSSEDFEHFTLSDQKGVNAHLSFDGKNVLSGRDPEHEMIARYVLPEEVYPSVFPFYNDGENAIVPGCAGLKGICGELAPVASLGLYLFGEVCMTESGPEFGNLMLSKIRFIKK